MKKMSANAMIAANGGKKTSATCDLCKKNIQALSDSGGLIFSSDGIYIMSIIF